MANVEWDIVFSLGLVLSTALLGGLVAEIVHLPRVTAYLLVGLLLGPHSLHLIPHDHLERLEPVGNLAMALVLLIMGCHFTVRRFRRIARSVLRLSAGEISLTFLLVSVGLGFVLQDWSAGLLFGALALATAPATTILVLKEIDSEGPVTEYAIALVALNNLIAVVLFEILLSLVQNVHGDQGIVTASAEIRRLAIDLGGSILLGVVAGLVASYLCGLWPRERWLVLLFAVATLLLGFCTSVGVPYLLTFLAMGATVANASDRSKEIVDELDRITGILCLIFFVIHGAELDLAALVAAGVVGVAYIILRSAGKYFGVYLTANPHEDGREVRGTLGATLWPQAGAAIALASVAAAPTTGLGDLGQQIQVIILGTVVYFEIIGPIATRMAVVRAGEVPLDRVIHHTTTTPLEELRLLVNRVIMRLGFNPWQRREPNEVKVGDIMRRDVKAIPAEGRFEQVVDFIEQSHDNLFVVVDRDEEVVGIIRYLDLRDALFDPALSRLVRAEDLALPAFSAVHPEDPVSDAMAVFRRSDDDCVPVLTTESPHKLVGLIRRRDMFRYFLKGGVVPQAEDDQGRDAL